MAEKESDLLEFYGTECVHCHTMEPFVQKLEQETGLKLQKIEVWHNAENAAFMEKCDKGRCMGVPFFYNKKTDKFICGATDYQTLKKWALEGHQATSDKKSPVG